MCEDKYQKSLSFFLMSDSREVKLLRTRCGKSSPDDVLISGENPWIAMERSFSTVRLLRGVFHLVQMHSLLLITTGVSHRSVSVLDV